MLTSKKREAELMRRNGGWGAKNGLWVTWGAGSRIEIRCEGSQSASTGPAGGALNLGEGFVVGLGRDFFCARAFFWLLFLAPQKK